MEYLAFFLAYLVLVSYNEYCGWRDLERTLTCEGL